MNKVIEPNRVYNVPEASEILGVNEQTLLEYLREGKIKAQKIGEWKILGQNLIDFLSVKNIEILPNSYQLENGMWIPRATVITHFGDKSVTTPYAWVKHPIDDEHRANFLAGSWTRMLLTIKNATQESVTKEDIK